jgi:CHAT domain-containing protein
MSDEIRRYAREAFRQMDEGTKHPSEEEFAAMLGGDLTEERRVEISGHLASCAECRERAEDLDQFLADAVQPPDRDLTREWQRLRQRIRPVRTAMVPLWAGIAAAVVAAVAPSYFVWTRIVDSPSRLLAKAYAEQRTFDFRVAGGAYAPMQLARGGSAFASPESLLKAQARLAEEIRSKPDDWDVLRLRGEAELLARQASAAVETLQKAIDLRPDDPGVLADLGVAYALRGDLERQFGDYQPALDYLNRSLHFQPNAPQALFNRALVLERMLLKDQAVEAWEKYLAIDSASPWAAEARRRLTVLKAELKAREEALARVQTDPARFLELVTAGQSVDPEAYLEGVAVTEWLPSVPDAVTTRALQTLATLLQRQGDSWLAEILAAGRTPEEAVAVRELGTALAANRSGDANAGLLAAKRAERVRTSAVLLPARFEEVVSLRILLRSEECLAAAESVVRDLRAHPYLWFRAQALIEYANCALRVGRLSEAALRLSEAQELAHSAGLGGTALRAGIIFLDTVDFTGLPSEFFAGCEKALRQFWSGAYPRERYFQIVNRLGQIAAHSGQSYTAWLLARSGVWASAGPLVEPAARANLAATALAVGEDLEARSNLALADRLFPTIPDGYRVRTSIACANVDLARGDAGAALQRLLQVHVDAAPVLNVTEYYGALGMALLRRKTLPDAIRAFRTSIDMGTRMLSLTYDRERAGVLRAIETSYRGLVAATLAASAPPADSLKIWMEFAALDAGRPSAGRPANPLLCFLELPDEFVGWLVRNDTVTLRRLAVPKESLARVVRRFGRECSDPAPSGGLRQDARQLYEWLVEPFDAQVLDGGRELMLALDGVLAGVPVQALISSDGRYLGDRLTVTVSSGYQMAATERPFLHAGTRALIVADPAIAGNSAIQFPPLPDSRKEAEIIRAIFPGSLVLQGREATAAALEAAHSAAEVVHFAGHGYSGSGNGALLLAPKDPRTADYDLLTSVDLRRQDWSGCRLAVLSACAAAAGEAHGPHNPDSLVRALSKAGASQVVASLWNADSIATGELMRSFYGALADGAAPSQALEIAQQHVRQRREWDHPYYWAGFQMYGTF